MAEYSATRRTPRKHKRVVMKGTEQFDADGVKLEPGDMQTDQQRQSDDDKRILGVLPPHWAVFNERESELGRTLCAPTLCFPQPVGCGKHSIGRRPIPLPTAQRP